MVASREPAADAKPGTVVRQSVAPGQHVPRDYPLTVVLADELPKVPTVTGVNVAEATQRAEQRGFHLQVGATVPDANVVQGLVLDQTPKADTAQAKGATITVQVSNGPGDVELPKFVGVGIKQAQTDIEKLGLKAVVRWVALAETPTYVVLNQKPAPGEKAKPGSEVQLTVCR
jgi:serine/threonine-protein kinase